VSRRRVCNVGRPRSQGWAETEILALKTRHQTGAKVMTADGADLSSTADDPTRTLIRQVLSAVARFDKSVTVLKL